MSEEKKKADKKPAVKAEKPEHPSNAEIVKLLGNKGGKDRKDFAQKVLDYLVGKGYKENSRDFKLELEHIHAQIGAICRCITKGTGPKDWQNYELVETDTEFKIVKKATQ